MRLGWWGLIGLCAVAVSCQSSTNETEMQFVQQILSTVPPCALTCLAQGLATSACSPTDFACTCDDDNYNDLVTKCVKSTCTIRQQLTTQNATETICHRKAPVAQPPINITAISIAIFAFVLRILSKITFPCNSSQPQSLGWDDAVMAGAMVFLIIPVAISGIILVDIGLGRSVWTVSFDNITKIQHVYYFMEDLYLSALPAVRVSMLLTYLRIFAGQRFRNIVYVVIGFNVAYAITFVLISIFQCRPISLAWHWWDGEHEGHCNNINAQSWAAAGINIVLDVATLSLPLPQLWRMQLNKRKKFLVMLMFSMGFFVTVVSVIRLQQLLQFGRADNFTYHYSIIGYWSVIELDAAVVCACMPAIRNLIRRFSPRLMGVSTADMEGTQMTGLSGRTAVDSSLAKEVDACVRPRNDDESNFVPLENVDSEEIRRHVRNYSHPLGGSHREAEVYVDHNGRILAREPVSPI